MVKSAPSAAPQLATCALSGGAWWLWAACTRGRGRRRGQWPPDRCLGAQLAAFKVADLTAFVRPGELVTMHGWQPVVRGGCEVASKFEGGTMSFGRFLGNMKREICDGEKLSVGW